MLHTRESEFANKLASASAFIFKKMNIMNCMLPMNIQYPLNAAHTSFLADFWTKKLNKHKAYAIDSQHSNEPIDAQIEYH